MKIRIEQEVKELGIFVYSCEIRNVEVKSDPKIEEKMKESEKEFAKQNPEELKDDPVVRAYRNFYWRIGIDPTKTRPSGEALRRRVARGNPLPRINNIVDAGNIASLITLVPIGIYDSDRLKGDLRLKMSEGEEFLPIGEDKPFKLPDGIPILVDEENKVLHLYPHRDSKLTMINKDTKNILIIGAGVKGVEKDLVKRAVEITKELILSSCPDAKASEIIEN